MTIEEVWKRNSWALNLRTGFGPRIWPKPPVRPANPLSGTLYLYLHSCHIVLMCLHPAAVLWGGTLGLEVHSSILGYTHKHVEEQCHHSNLQIIRSVRDATEGVSMVCPRIATESPCQPHRQTVTLCLPLEIAQNSQSNIKSYICT